MGIVVSHEYFGALERPALKLREASPVGDAKLTIQTQTAILLRFGVKQTSHRRLDEIPYAAPARHSSDWSIVSGGIEQATNAGKCIEMRSTHLSRFRA